MHWKPRNPNSLNCKSANYQPLASQAIGSELNTSSASLVQIVFLAVVKVFLAVVKLSLSLFVDETTDSPSGAGEIPFDEIKERPFFAFAELGTSRESKNGEAKGERKEPALSSGETESLSPSSGLSFLMCLRMLASALDPELDSVRPASNATRYNNG